MAELEQEDDFPLTGNPEYDRLPVAIKHAYTLTQYLWLPDSSKATLVQRETEPEWTE